MKLQHENIREVQKNILDIVRKYLGSEYRVFFFGSRVTGKAAERSDIDIGIEGEHPVPKQSMAAIRRDMEDLPYLYSFDVVDFKMVSPEFYQVAKEKTESFT